MINTILLKISWEAFCGEWEKWITPGEVLKIAEMIEYLQSLGKKIVLVLGGGNIYRWSSLIAAGVKAVDSHNLSMLSTLFNAVTLKNFLEQKWIDCVVMDALHVEFVEPYRATQAQKYLKEGKIVICSSGTGAPFFTTDTGGVIRALELKCDIMIKATKVDGVYDKDPKKYSDARKYETLDYTSFITQNLQILDQSAIILARDNALKIAVIRFEKEALKRLLWGEKEGTLIWE